MSIFLFSREVIIILLKMKGDIIIMIEKIKNNYKLIIIGVIIGHILGDIIF